MGSQGTDPGSPCFPPLAFTPSPPQLDCHCSPHAPSCTWCLEPAQPGSVVALEEAGCGSVTRDSLRPCAARFTTMDTGGLCCSTNTLLNKRRHRASCRQPQPGCTSFTRARGGELTGHAMHTLLGHPSPACPAVPGKGSITALGAQVAARLGPGPRAVGRCSQRPSPPEHISWALQRARCLGGLVGHRSFRGSLSPILLAV